MALKVCDDEDLYTTRTKKYVMNKDIGSILHAMIMFECIMKRFIKNILHAMVLNQWHIMKNETYTYNTPT